MKNILLGLLATVLMSSFTFAQTDCIKLPGNDKESQILEDLLNSMNNEFVTKYEATARKLSSKDFLAYVKKKEGFVNNNKLGDQLILASYANITDFNCYNTVKLQELYGQYILAVKKVTKSSSSFSKNEQQFWGNPVTLKSEDGCKWYQIRCHLVGIVGESAADRLITYAICALAALMGVSC